MWATEHETREGITDLYRRGWTHSDATITELALDAPGHVPWWPRPDVLLFTVLVHILTDTARHAGHADILREQLDGATGTGPWEAGSGRDAAVREARRAEIERAAGAAVRERARDHRGGAALTRKAHASAGPGRKRP